MESPAARSSTGLSFFEKQPGMVLMYNGKPPEPDGQGASAEQSSLEGIASGLESLDIEVQSLKRQLADRTRSLEGASAARTRMMTALVHEVRNGLTPIIGFSDLLLAGSRDLGEARVKQVRTIYQNARMIEALVDAMAEAVRLEQGQLSLNSRTFDFRSSVVASLDAFHPYASARNLTVETAVADGAAVVLGDAPRLTRVVNALLQNGADRSPEGGTLRVGMERQGARVSFWVSDQGERLTPAETETLFVPFTFSGERPKEMSVLALLSLSVSRGVVQLHGGHMSTVNGPWSGSTFSFWVPQARGEKAAPGL